MSDQPEVCLVERFFRGTGLTYDYMVNLCTVGVDVWWKKKIMEKIPEEPKRIIDQACGTGILTFKIASAYPRCEVIGVELRDEYLNIAKDKSKALRLGNVQFILGRAEDVILEEGVDCITSSYLAKYADLDVLVPNARKMLRSRGLLVIHDFIAPTSAFFTLIWNLHFRLLKRLGGRKYPSWRTILNELPGLLRETRWVGKLVGLLQSNAFSTIAAERLTFGYSAIVTARK